MTRDDVIFTPGASEAVWSDATFDLRLGWMLWPIWQCPKTHDIAPLAVTFFIRCLKLLTKYQLTITDSLHWTFNSSQLSMLVYTTDNAGQWFTQTTSIYRATDKLWRSKIIERATKPKIFNANLKAVMLYASKTWMIYNTMMDRLQVSVKKRLQRTVNVQRRDRITYNKLITCNGPARQKTELTWILTDEMWWQHCHEHHKATEKEMWPKNVWKRDRE